MGRSAHELYVHPISYQWLLLALLTLASGSATVKLPSVAASISISEAFVFTAILLYGPAAGTLTVALDGLAISFWIAKRRPEPARALFNMAAPALSAWCAAQVFFRASNTLPLGSTSISLGAILPYLFVSALTYFCINSLLISLAISAETGLNALMVWRKNFIWLSLNYFCGASIAGLLVVYRPEVTLPYIAAVLPILIVIYFTFKTTMGRVEDANRHVQKINKLYLSTIETLAMAIDAKDQITHGHIRRVQKYAIGLAKEIGVRDAPLLSAIEAAALLHDMGKLAIPEYILNKPGKLTELEFEQMKAHATIGAEILSSIDFPYPVVPIVRHHHENWDGSGYPDRLSGTDIPIGARILSVVDCFDALTSDRPYRLALSLDAAFRILIERRGKMYDPLVVDTFIHVHNQISPDEAATGLSGNVLKELAAANSPSHATAMNSTTGTAELGFTSLELARIKYSHNLEMIGDISARALARSVTFNAFILFIRDNEASEIVPVFVSGQDLALLNELRVPLGKGVSGWAAAHERSLANLNSHLDFGEAFSKLTNRLSAVMSVPLISREQSIGALTAYSVVETGFTQQDHAVLEGLAAMIGDAVADVRATYLAPKESDWLALPDSRDFVSTWDATRARGDCDQVVLVIEPEDRCQSRNTSFCPTVSRALSRALLSKRPCDVVLRHEPRAVAVVLEGTTMADAERFAKRIEHPGPVPAKESDLAVRVVSPHDASAFHTFLARSQSSLRHSWAD